MKKLFFIVLAASLALLFISNTNAAGDCQPIYGGGKNCLPQKEVLLDKKVQQPDSSDFVDSLGQDSKYKSGETINFQISITNQTGKTINELEIKDYYPQILTDISGPGEVSGNTISFKVIDLRAKESRKFVLVGKIRGLEKDSCFTNYTQTKFKNKTINDNSRFCVEASEQIGQTDHGQTTKGGLPVKSAPPLSQTPATGPEMLSLLALIPMAFIGKFIIRKA